MPLDFDVSARLGSGRHFVVEADEYDTAFFDKRAKFVHYRPRTAILNNLEHDHADIYPDVASIQRQFHLLLRTVPGNGRLVVNGADRNLAEVLGMGCWTPVERFASDAAVAADWHLVADPAAAYAKFAVYRGERCVGEVEWGLLGRHNAENGLAALVAAHHAGVDAGGRDRGAVPVSRCAAPARGARYGGRRGRVRRFRASPDRGREHARGRAPQGGAGRVIAVLEPRSNTMKLGTHKAALADSLRGANRVFVYKSPEVKWDVGDAMVPLGSLVAVHEDLARLTEAIVAEARPGDHLVLMSNGSFGGLHERLLEALKARAAA